MALSGSTRSGLTLRILVWGCQEGRVAQGVKSQARGQLSPGPGARSWAARASLFSRVEVTRYAQWLSPPRRTAAGAQIIHK